MFTYYGGESIDRAWTMTIDNSYRYVITGISQSENLPTSLDAFQNVSGSGDDAYVAVIDYNGASLNYSSYLAGNDDEYGLGINIDDRGGIIIAGQTSSDDFPTTEGAYQVAPRGGIDTFVARISRCRTFKWCTRIAGGYADRAWDSRVDPEGNVVVVGRVTSSDFPTVNAPQPTKARLADAFVSKLSWNGSSLLGSTFVGGNGTDYGEGLDVDDEGNIVISGSTSSDEFPVTSGAYQEELGGSRDAFVCNIAFIPEDTDSTTTSTTTTTNGTENSVDWLLVTVGVGCVAVILMIIVIVKMKR
jgi:hypothetical protein